MKYFLLPLVLLCVACGVKEIVYDPLTFDETFGCELEQDDLYVASNSWMVETFNNAKSVIQFTYKEEGVIKGKYLMHTREFTNLYGTVLNTEEANAIITINVRDNFTKITVDPFGKGTASSMYTNPETDPNVYASADVTADTKTLIELCKNYIQNYKGER